MSEPAATAEENTGDRQMSSSNSERQHQRSGSSTAGLGVPPKGRSVLEALNINQSSRASSSLMQQLLPVELQSTSSQIQRRHQEANRERGPRMGHPKVLAKAPKPAAASAQPGPSSSFAGHGEEATRRSQRAIKRKKFDDEIVDTLPAAFLAPPLTASHPSLPETPTATAVTPSTAPASLSMGLPSTVFFPPATPLAPPIPGVMSRLTSLDSPVVPNPARPRAMSLSSAADPVDTATKRVARKAKTAALENKKKKKPKKDPALKDLGRWKPTDDLALITAVLQTNDLHMVHRGIKFSCHFTHSEIQTRWQALLYKPIISKLALQSIRNLHPEVILHIQRKTLLDQQERDLLAGIKSNSNPNRATFADLLTKNPGKFHFARTPRFLQHNWQWMKMYNLLPDQNVQPLSRDAHIMNFLDAEASIDDSELYEGVDEVLGLELGLSDRKCMREIRHLEAEIQKWQVLVDKVKGENPPDFDNQTLAVLRGRQVRYLMRSKEITLGRTARGFKVDVDLKLEGPAWKISRRQGVIGLRSTGEFELANEGRRSFFVDGKPIRRGFKVRLHNNSVLEIAGLRFVFLINQDLIDAVRNEAHKIYQSTT